MDEFTKVTNLEETHSSMIAQTAQLRDIKLALDQHAIVSIANAKGKIIYANDKFSLLSKYSREELIGQDHRIVNSGFHSKEFFQKLWNDISNGRTWHGEIRNRAKDGSYYWVATSIVPFLGSDGKPFQYVSIRTDITEQKRNEHQIIEVEERIKSATEIANIGIWEWRISTNTLHWDDTMYRLYGIDRKAFAGAYEAWVESLHPEDRARATGEVERAIQSDSPLFDTMFRIILPNGCLRYIKARAIVHFDSNGKAIRMIGGNWDVTREITELKRIETQLVERTKEAEAATEAKSRFLANMSHEIQTPLTSIIGYCETLCDSDLSAQQQREAAGAAYSSAIYLLDIVTKVLDFSKLEAGKVNIQASRVNLFDLLDEVLTIERKKLESNQLQMNLEYCFPLPSFFQVDPTALKQILFNLINNAIKFTSSGQITIRITYDKEKGSLSLSVVDTGMGIEYEQSKNLFKAFSQGDASTTRRFGGSGLGLAISKHLALLLGGDITYKSVPKKGSSFTITIPTGTILEQDLTYVEQSKVVVPSATTSSMPQFSGRVLVVEDSIDIQKYLHLLLTKLGFEVTVVANGEEAIKYAVNGEYCLIIMDMHLPDSDGQTATRTIRQSGTSCPILALSADVRQENINECIQAGCNDFLPKPFRRALLAEKLQLLLEPKLITGLHSNSNSSELDFVETAKEFVASFSIQVEELEKLLISQEFELLTKAAHKLAGATAFAYTLVYEPLFKLSEAARDKCPDTCGRLLDQIKQVHFQYILDKEIVGTSALS